MISARAEYCCCRYHQHTFMCSKLSSDSRMSFKGSSLCRKPQCWITDLKFVKYYRTWQ